jgi:hypothetical protein
LDGGNRQEAARSGKKRQEADIDDWLLQHGSTQMPYRFAHALGNG